MCITGHKNMATLDSFTEGPSNTRRAEMSAILAAHGNGLETNAVATVTHETCNVQRAENANNEMYH